jgi:hypothetical protein
MSQDFSGRGVASSPIAAELANINPAAFIPVRRSTGRNVSIDR